MKKVDVIAAVLVVVAALFGEMTVLSRLVYTLVGVSAVYQALSFRAIQRRWGSAGAQPARA